MKEKFIHAFLAGLLMIVISGGRLLGQYEVIDLGTLGGRDSCAYAINDKGQVVGKSDTETGEEHAVLWDGGVITDLGTANPNHRTAAYSINEQGQIVGYRCDEYGGAVLFDATGMGGNVDLGTLGGDMAYAHSINDDGQIVGHADLPGGCRRATLFDSTGNGDNINLGAAGRSDSIALSINNEGKAVGYLALPFQAVLFDVEGVGNVVELRTLGGDGSIARDINNKGQIVGDAGGSATLFDPTGNENNTDLGTAGSDRSRAMAINNKGVIVGYDGWGGRPQVADRAVLFDPTGNGANIDLNTLIDPDSGWLLQRAKDINNNGWIVGYGINPQGYEHGFLLIPEPATLALFALGGLAVLRRRRR